MGTYTLAIQWKRGINEHFIDNQYSREHRWIFDGGVELAASSSPHVVPLPLSKEEAVDPEEAFVASIASCHMLWFLSIAAANGFVVDRYEDHPEGILAKDEKGKLAMVSVTLKPSVGFGRDNIPSTSKINELHSLAHDKCFIANSVRTKISIIQNQKQEGDVL